MKVLHVLFALAFALLSTLLTGCGSEDEPTPPAISVEEAAEVIATSLAADNGGLAREMAEAAQSAQALADGFVPGEVILKNDNCGVLTPLNLQISKPNGVITFDYALSMSLLLGCVNNVPNSAGLDFTSTGAFDSPRIASNSTATAELSLGGINPASGSLLAFNGSYSRSGSLTLKLRNLSTTNTLSASLDVDLNPNNYLFVGGSGQITLSGTTSTGGSYNYSAQLSILQNNLAQLTINGVLFQINLTTGAYSN
ncbi:MAG: hypothetical protein HC913_22520 [Microscillaceae bacterium]|nr:hypothetical protein [Microscillaceae bacterium]